MAACYQDTPRFTAILLSKSRTKNYGCLPWKSARSRSSTTALAICLATLASMASLVRMMNSRQGCNEITPVSALSVSASILISHDNVEQNFIYRSNKHFSTSRRDMNMSLLCFMKQRKLNFSHLVFPQLLLASSSSIRGETIGSNPTNIRLGKSD